MRAEIGLAHYFVYHGSVVAVSVDVGTGAKHDNIWLNCANPGEPMLAAILRAHFSRDERVRHAEDDLPQHLLVERLRASSHATLFITTDAISCMIESPTKRIRRPLSERQNAAASQSRNAHSDGTHSMDRSGSRLALQEHALEPTSASFLGVALNINGPISKAARTAACTPSVLVSQ
eukprot:CAMPEP_0119345450 /NCGR_PEP_ID=MMETSP1333-20130426/107492_1 /TAXON_ID=418940 /ORGANISM="Scyphosphaera apsteinii, Strain RCC1455" /LENGTH=176 /DNA_ID=CAMNT_0007357919 /DNA_START=704 /DNA_END=1235 /DNA_ORIENTATION=+